MARKNAGRRREPQHRDAGRAGAAAAVRGPQSEEHAEHTGEQRGRERELEGRRRELRDVLEHRTAGAQRLAEVRLRDVAEEVDVLRRERIVVAELLALRLDDLLASPAHRPRRGPGRPGAPTGSRRPPSSARAARRATSRCGRGSCVPRLSPPPRRGPRHRRGCRRTPARTRTTPGTPAPTTR